MSRRLQVTALAAGLSLLLASACSDRAAPGAGASLAGEDRAASAAEARTHAAQDARASGALGSSMLANLAAAGPSLPVVGGGLSLYALEPVGEIELDGARVERSYRITLLNRGEALGSLVVRLRDAGPRVEIVSSELRVGALGPEERSTPSELLVLRHPSSLLPAPEDLRWAVQASDDSEGPNGALLRGGAADPAAAALRGYTAGPPPAFTAQPLHVEAVLTQTATVGQVNQVLRQTATRISGMRPNNRMLSLRMEPGEGLASMERRLGVLQDSGAFERLQPVHVPGLGAAGRAVPGELPPPDAEPDFDDHRDI